MDKEFATLKAHWVGGQIDDHQFVAASGRLGSARAQDAMEKHAAEIGSKLPQGWRLTRTPSGYTGA